jgi:tetratricopeptide (TPR) repeat protein
MKQPLILVVFLFICEVSFSQTIQQRTISYNSPSIWAKNTAVNYGLNPLILDELATVFETNGLDSLGRQEAAEELIQRFNTLKPDEIEQDQLTDEAKETLGIEGDAQLEDILEWQLYTEGPNSPAIFALGNVEVWYGISQPAFRGIVAILQTKQSQIENAEEVLAQQIERFKELEEELATRAPYDEVAAQAKALLDQGDIEGAEQLLEKDYRNAKKQTAFRGYELAKVKELSLKYGEATEFYRDAAYLDPQNSAYLNAYGENLFKIGSFEEAARQFQLALTSDLERFGPDSPQVARSYNNLGLAYQSLGAYDRAIDLYQKALAIDTAVYGLQHPDVARNYNNLGLAFDSKGAYDRAIALYEQALAIDTAVYGLQHPTVARSYNNLGSAFDSKGAYDRAIALYEQALAIDIAVYGLQHPSVAMTYNNLGGAFDSKGAYDRAIALYQQALAIDTAVYGLQHPSVARSYNNLGSAFDSKGAYGRAIALYEQALAIDKAVYGLQHPTVATRYNNLGLAFDSKGEYDRAIELLQQALAIDTAVYGLQHPAVATMYNNLGLAFDSKGAYDRAIALYEQALAIDTAIYGLQHPTVARSYNNLGSAYHSKGAYNRAIALYEQALAIDTAVYGLQHPDVARDYNNLGEAYRQLGEYDRAIELYQQALAINTAVYGLQHPTVATIYNNLGSAFDSKGEYDRAIEFYEKALEIWIQFLPASHPNLRTVRQNLSPPANAYGMQFYQEAKWDTAIRYFQIGLMASLGAEDSSFAVTCLNNLGSCKKHLAAYDSALYFLEWGIGLAERLDERVMVEVRQLPDSVLNHPNFPAYLEQNILHTFVLRRIYFHQASTLWRMGHQKEAAPIFRELWEAAAKREDEKLRKEIEAEGYVYEER